jgi:hypothetical protein
MSLNERLLLSTHLTQPNNMVIIETMSICPEGAKITLMGINECAY